jgi:hypothetical protein
MSAAGVITELFSRITKAVTEQGGVDWSTYRLTRDDGQETINAIAKEIVRALGQPMNVIVRYGLPLPEAIRLGHYDAVWTPVAEMKIPVRPVGVVNQHMILRHYNRVIKTSAILADLKKYGLRPATLPELLAVGEQAPELQKQFPVVALGQTCRFGTHLCCPELTTDLMQKTRELVVVPADTGWPQESRFLAIPK